MNAAVPHFTWTISANERMQFESEIMIRSASFFKKYFCTIWVLEDEIDLISSNLKRMPNTEVLPYKPILGFNTPWASTPKWNVEPKGDVVVGIDADVMVWSVKNLQDYLNLCLQSNSICACVAYFMPKSCPHKNAGSEEWTVDDWNDFSKEIGVEFEYNYKSNSSLKKGPFYFNNGGVLIPNSLLKNFREGLQKWLPVLNKKLNSCYHFVQIANTVVINEQKIPHIELPVNFNYLEYAKGSIKNPEKIALFHYNITRNILYCKNDFNKLEKVFKNKMKNIFLKI